MIRPIAFIYRRPILGRLPPVRFSADAPNKLLFRMNG